MAQQRSVEMLAFIFLGRTFAYKGLHKVLADLCLLFQLSCVSIWIKLSKLTNVLKRWTTLESQPIMLRTSPGPFLQSSNAFVKQDWNWQLRNATLELDKLNSWEEQLHRKESHHKREKFKISKIYLYSPSQKRRHNDIWVSWKITKIIFPECLKDIIHSTNCWKRKYQSTLRQSWKKHLIQSIKLSVTFAN